MAKIHDKDVRGRTQTGWLDSHHTFSFGGFNDPSRMGHRALRVLNEDRVIPGAGFGEHDHEAVDILTYVLSGALKHADSIGNGSTIGPGEIQHMWAGTGVSHSEMNASGSEAVHFLQIWLLPDKAGGKPTYTQKPIDDSTIRNRLGLLAGPHGKAPIALQSDNYLFLARLDDGQHIEHRFEEKRAGFIHVVDGMITIEGERLSAGDGLEFAGEEVCSIDAASDCEVLLFDLA